MSTVDFNWAGEGLISHESGPVGVAPIAREIRPGLLVVDQSAAL